LPLDVTMGILGHEGEPGVDTGSEEAKCRRRAAEENMKTLQSGGEDGRVRFTTSSESQSGACWSEKHHHAPLWLYATPAHAIRDVLHASNYLTITEGSGRFGSLELAMQGRRLIFSEEVSCNSTATHFQGLKVISLRERRRDLGNGREDSGARFPRSQGDFS